CAATVLDPQEIVRKSSSPPDLGHHDRIAAAAAHPLPRVRTMTTLLLDRELIAEIRRIEQATGRDDLFSGFVHSLERSLAGFGAAFSDCIARGDTSAAARAAHTLKGGCRQLGARA